ncbi:MAG: response regulator transcription factor [Eubacteriales bacterium]|nr:response regulator transcription factor [Eubacteriales bacterium]
MKDKSILIVDDETGLLEMLQSIFERAGYTNITTATSGRTALKIFREHTPDMVILDVMMPGMDGFTVLKEIRKISTVPVLMLTARGEADDKFSGFENGADDYLVKPFLSKELLLRVQAILNRAYPEKERIVHLAASTVNLDKAKVYRGEEIFSLTAKEFTLFEKLFENAGRIVTTGSLCETVCGEIWEGYENTLVTHIRHLREKIESNPSKPVSLLNVKGLGYRLIVKERNNEIN